LQPPPKSEVVVIVSADIEWRAVRRRFPACRVRSSPLGEWFVAAIGEDSGPVLFFHGGWGKIAAAASMQYLITMASPKLVVNIGTCGGFRGAVERGTIILVERTVVYDILEQMGDNDESIAYYATDIDLGWLGERYPHKVIRSLMLSGDRDLAAKDLSALKQKFGAIVGDWESGSIAWVARKNGVRILILRGVTDLVGESGGEAYGKVDIFNKRATSIADQLIDQLPDWIRPARRR
jgi:adenosylhomocysteine nucleosidase